LASVDQLNQKEKTAYDELVQSYWDTYNDPERWGPIIALHLKARYTQTRVIGKENFEELLPKKIYVAAAYMDMGRNNYIVRLGKKTYFHETQVSYRREQVPFVLKTKVGVKTRQREANVFTVW